MPSHGCLTRCVRPSEFATTVIGPSNMGGPEVSAFLTHLASDRNVAAVTQNQALTGLLFGYGGVELPCALERKYPRAHLDFGWQYVFPADRPSRDPRTGA